MVFLASNCSQGVQCMSVESGLLWQLAFYNIYVLTILLVACGEEFATEFVNYK